MKQFSNDGSIVELELISGYLLFIDPLHFQKINGLKIGAKILTEENSIAFIKEIEEKVFPYGGGFLLGFKAVTSRNDAFAFNISQMHQYNDEDINISLLAADKKVTAFATDSGTFLILDIANFDMLLDLITFDELIDAALKNMIEPYFRKINAQLGNQGWAFVQSPGTDSNFVFKGSGAFILEEK